MARIRSIKPEFWTSEQVMECTPLARLLFIGIWNFCDDGGNHPDAEKSLKALIFPGDDIDSASVRRMLDELSERGLLTFYEHDGKRYLHVNGWHHQKIDRPTFKYPCQVGDPQEMGPAPHVVDEQSPNDRRGLDHGEDRERKGRGKEKSKSKSKSSEPSKRSAKSTTVTVAQMTTSVEGLSAEVAEAYLAHRRAKRAPLTPLAWKGVANTLLASIQRGADPDKVLSKAIERGWTGLEIEWLGNAGVLPRGSPPSDQQSAVLSVPTHTQDMYPDDRL